MTVLFFDRQELSNPMNGLRIKSKIELDEALEKLGNREPFVFELVGENGYKLLVGVGKAIADFSGPFTNTTRYASLLPAQRPKRFSGLHSRLED
jgi:hypothetical protein